MNKMKIASLALAIALCLPFVAEAKGAKKVLQGQVNINTASVQELSLLPGIGAKKAEAIVALRSTKPFTSVDDLNAIKGIGPKLVEKLRPFCTVQGATTAKLAKAEIAPTPVK